MKVIPIETLFEDGSTTSLRAETRAAIARADVIIGIDAASQNEFTVFGTPALEETVTLGKEVALRTLRVALNVDNGELEKLVGVVRAIKRGQDYLGE